MTTVVLDASVIVKWIFADRAEESHSLQALQILQFIKESREPLSSLHTGWPKWRRCLRVWTQAGLVRPCPFCTRLSFLS